MKQNILWSEVNYNKYDASDTVSHYFNQFTLVQDL